jgi:protein-tyrosine-phosphatase
MPGRAGPAHLTCARAEDSRTGRVEREYDHVLVGGVPADSRPHLDAAEVADVGWPAPALLRLDLDGNPDRYAPGSRPLAMQMATHLCGDGTRRAECAGTISLALAARTRLWDGILAVIGERVAVRLGTTGATVDLRPERRQGGTMRKRTVIGLGMFGLGVGYFAWYTPYSALTKGVSTGLLPGVDHAVGGLVLLPATVLGQLVAMPFLVAGAGWLRYPRRRAIAGRRIPLPGRYTIESSVWMAFIVGTTTLNFTFPGASIVFMLVLMRITTLVTAPVMDLMRRRKIHWYSSVAMALCALSAVVALTDIGNYTLTSGAVLSVALYAVGYFFRFRLIGVHAKSGDLRRDRQYFIEEHITTPFMLLLMVGIPAVIDQGPWMHALRLGFTSFLATWAVVPALLIGVCYEGLFVMTSLIFINRREFSFGVPVHVCASLLAGIAASFILHGAYDVRLPSAAQYVAAASVICAALVLSYPTIRAYCARRRLPRTAAWRLLFVCGGNTSRSPIAAAIARAELDANAAIRHWDVSSAGVSVHSPGTSISSEAATVLLELGIEAPFDHRTRQLTPVMCADSDAIYCMTRDHRESVVAIAPEAAGRTVCIDANVDVPEPAGHIDAYRDCARRLRTLIRQQLREQGLSKAGVTGSSTG